MKRFSAGWSDSLQKSILELAPEDGYNMELKGEDAKLVRELVNQGIDAHLEACFIPDRGDQYEVQGATLKCRVSPKSLAVLLRRLFEAGHERAELLASDICATLGIELI